MKFQDVRVATTPILQALCDTADEYEFNRRIAVEEIDLDPNGFHVIGIILPNHTPAIRMGTESPIWPQHHRCYVLMKIAGTDEPVSGELDIPVVDWESLATPDEIIASSLSGN